MVNIITRETIILISLIENEHKRNGGPWDDTKCIPLQYVNFLIGKMLEIYMNNLYKQIWNIEDNIYFFFLKYSHYAIELMSSCATDNIIDSLIKFTDSFETVLTEKSFLIVVKEYNEFCQNEKLVKQIGIPEIVYLLSDFKRNKTGRHDGEITPNIYTIVKLIGITNKFCKLDRMLRHYYNYDQPKEHYKNTVFKIFIE